MTPRKRFLLGGGGALMPVLVSILAVDIATVIDSESGLTTGNVIGFVIRYMILFTVGGIVAWLHEDESKSFKLFELGIAAPALITSLVTAQGLVARGGDLVPVEPALHAPALVSEAFAADGTRAGEGVLVAGLIGDVWSGITGRAYQQSGVRKAATVTAKPSAGDDGQDAAEADELRRELEAEKARALIEREAEKARALLERERLEQLEAEAAAARARAERLERALEEARTTSTQ